MIPDWSIIGFSGHRALTNPGSIAAHIGAALDRLASICGSVATVSSSASGADILFLEEVARRKLPHLIILPFHKARFEKDFTAADWQRVQACVKNAQHIEEISSAASDAEAYMEVGERTVEQADIVIAVWDGKPAAGLGGTADAVAHARMLDKPLIWINPVTSIVSEERLDRLSAALVAEVCTESPRRMVEEHFLKLDEKAGCEAPKARHLVQRIILLHLFASAVGLSVPTMGLHGAVEYSVMLVDLAMLLTVFFLTSAHRRKHEGWLQIRIEEKICRSFLATWDLRGRAEFFSRIAIQGFDRLCKNLRMAQFLDNAERPTLAEASTNYLKKRIRTQMAYYSKQSTMAHRAHHRLKVSALGCTATAALAIVGRLTLLHFHVTGLVLSIPELLALGLPLVSAALFSIILTQEYSRRSERNREMVAGLEHAAKQLNVVRTWNGLARIAADTEQQLIQEVVEWHSFSRFAGQQH
jgi:nucleoside 2-deoxyribosyltransferase